MRLSILAMCTLIASGSCSRSTPDSGGPPAAPAKHFGDIMSEVGRRFERAGRAVAAARWDLADYDIGEIDEVFTQDIPTAIMPPDVHLDLRPTIQAFASTVPGELRKAIGARDRAAFEQAFARAAAQCNGCHQAAGRAFIEVPSTLGVSVPKLDAVAAAPDVGAGHAP
jgi:hypothetical protein